MQTQVETLNNVVKRLFQVVTGKAYADEKRSSIANQEPVNTAAIVSNNHKTTVLATLPNQKQQPYRLKTMRNIKAYAGSTQL